MSDVSELTPAQAIKRANLTWEGKGRIAGTPNKHTVLVKEAFEYAFKETGGAEGLAQWARAHRTEFYQLFAKMLPTQTKVDVNVAIGLNDRLLRAMERLDPRIVQTATKLIEGELADGGNGSDGDGNAAKSDPPDE
jgi:hypothetical protein